MGEYKANVLCMQRVNKPTRDRGIIWQKNTQKPLKWSQRQLGMHATLISLKHKQKRQKGRGVSLPYARPQNLFFTTENPLDFSGEKANTQKVQSSIKEGTKGAKQGLRGRGRPPTPKWPEWKILSMKIQDFFQLCTKLKSVCKTGQKLVQERGIKRNSAHPWRTLEEQQAQAPFCDQNQLKTLRTNPQGLPSRSMV